MEISVTDAVEDKYDFQALLVNVSKQDGLNTPVYASSDPNILLFYTSAGETQNILNNSKKEM
ncbi:hypothetical protein MSWHS_0422 [Methanosarcina sp. WWM596]|nr:hypothetical protein MSWHS_0422 [Methanosarcina sp. WWM596]AKB20683.1 hypothetical protein MSWH1_0412 [Methanosarcina sp. WH1]